MVVFMQYNSNCINAGLISRCCSTCNNTAT